MVLILRNFLYALEMSWYLLALLAAIFWGIYSIIQKKALEKTDPLSFLVFLALIISFLSLPIILTRDIFIFTPFEMLLMVIKSFFAGLFLLYIAKALKKMEISEFAPFLSFSAVIVLILSYFFLNEKVGPVAMLGVFMIVFGAYVLELKDGFLSPFRAIRENRGIHYVFIGIFFGSIVAIIDRFLLVRGPDILSFYALHNILIMLVVVLFSFFRKNNLKKLKMINKKTMLLILVAAIFYLIGDFSYLLALSIPAGMVALVISIKRISILVSTVVGGGLFHEKRLIQKSMAAMIMLIGAFLVAI